VADTGQPWKLSGDKLPIHAQLAKLSAHWGRPATERQARRRWKMTPSRPLDDRSWLMMWNEL